MGTTFCVHAHFSVFVGPLEPVWPEDFKKKSPNFGEKSSQNSAQAKNTKIYIKAQFESPKLIDQTTFEPLKNLWQAMLQNFLFRWKCKI